MQSGGRQARQAGGRYAGSKEGRAGRQRVQLQPQRQWQQSVVRATYGANEDAEARKSARTTPRRVIPAMAREREGAHTQCDVGALILEIGMSIPPLIHPFLPPFLYYSVEIK